MDSQDGIDLTVSRSWTAESARETMQLADRMARAWDAPVLIALSGPLGAGKTTFVRGVVNALAQQEEPVRSPTFTLINEYKSAEPPVVHADLYRAESRNQQETIGLEDYFDRGILMVEWADRWQGTWPEHAGLLQFDYTGQRSREITWSPEVPEQIPSPEKTVGGAS